MRSDPGRTLRVGDWPVLRGTAVVVSPALPVVVDDDSVVGPDGEYSGDASGVWREAGGATELYLATDASQPAPGAPFDLLWFGETERYLVRDGSLEIDNLFGALRVPAEPQLLDRILVRSRRVDGEVLVSLPPAATEGRQVIEVRRPAALSANDRWRDAIRLLAARADIDDVRPHGSRLEARTVDGVEVSFELEDGPAGWRLTLREGDYALNEIGIAAASNTLSLSATLDPRIDALAPGMRDRLIFDLRSDLVTLG
jgi:hypothetical protein